jgi:hypothetical protein
VYLYSIWRKDGEGNKEEHPCGNRHRGKQSGCDAEPDTVADSDSGTEPNCESRAESDAESDSEWKSKAETKTESDAEPNTR